MSTRTGWSPPPLTIRWTGWSSLETSTRGRTVQSLGYGYDRVGSLIRIDDALRSGGALAAGRQYLYDDLYRVTSGTGADRSWSYAFSDAGDLSSKSDVGAYVLGKGHQVASAGGQGYVYDAAGNVIERPGSKLRYDAKGRLRRVEMTDGTVVSYRYDHTGQRVVKESTGPKGSHRTVYVDRISEERDGQFSDYVFAGDVRVARIGGERPTPVALGRPCERPTPSPWGSGLDPARPGSGLRHGAHPPASGQGARLARDDLRAAGDDGR